MLVVAQKIYPFGKIIKHKVYYMKQTFTKVIHITQKMVVSRLAERLQKGAIKMISPSNTKVFLAVMKTLRWRLTALSMMSSSQKILPKVRLTARFLQYLLVMNKRHGTTYMVKYLKCGQLAIQRYLAGSPLQSFRDLEPDLPLPRLSRRGLPTIIQTRDLTLLANRGEKVVRFWLTLFALYRIIELPSKVKLDTITSPFCGDGSFLDAFEKGVPMGLSVFNKWMRGTTLPTNGLLCILKAGPSGSPNTLSLINDVFRLQQVGLFDKIMSYCHATGNPAIWHQLRYIVQRSVRCRFDQLILSLPCRSMGKLSLKVEPAGKVRVFAMVDAITQSALKPLHEWLFDILKRVPNDGTHDQEAAFKRAVEKAKLNNCSFGYDLSAATDRLPVSLQEKILAEWFGSSVSKLWKEILVDRDYVLEATDKTVDLGVTETLYLRYAVGQPMGAYSSWAMLAITHHYIVQESARRAHVSVNGEWFEGYELLGDDIVIFNESVAHQYLEIMSGLGVSINLAKSVISNPGSVVEFAKRTSVNGRDVSAISAKMLLAASSFKDKAQIAVHLSMKVQGHFNTFMQATLALSPSAMYKNSIPYLPRYVSRLFSSLLARNAENWMEVIPLLINKDKLEEFYSRARLQAPWRLVERIMNVVAKRGEIDFNPSPEQMYVYKTEETLIQEGLISRILKSAKLVTKCEEVANGVAKEYEAQGLSTLGAAVLLGKPHRGPAELVTGHLYNTGYDVVLMAWIGPALIDLINKVYWEMGYNKLVTQGDLEFIPGFSGAIDDRVEHYLKIWVMSMENPKIAAELRHLDTIRLSKILLAIENFLSLVKKIDLLRLSQKINARNARRSGDYDWSDKFLNELSDLRKVWGAPVAPLRPMTRNPIPNKLIISAKENKPFVPWGGPMPSWAYFVGDKPDKK